MLIGLDVGGTHTDAVLIGKRGLVAQVKVPTKADDLFGTILSCLTQITCHTSPQRIQRVVLSTTLTTNAIIQQQLPDVGMIVSAGPGIDPRCFKTNAHYYCVEGAIDHRGRETAALNTAEIRRVAAQAIRSGTRFIGVVSKFSTRNPQHEIQIADMLQDQCEAVFMGHQISGQLSFPRRIATTYLNTAVFAIHQKFYTAVTDSLTTKGITAPLRILKADGGNMNLATSLTFPAQTIFSGPAASVMGSVAYASPQAVSLVIDVGGTTTDMALVVDQTPLLEPQGIEINGYKTLIRALNTRSIGLGGDSRISVREGKLKIGPRRRGPAMAFGGSDPTPTDAFCVLGHLRKGDPSLAAKGIQSLAEAWGNSVEATAQAIYERTCQLIWEAACQMVDDFNQRPVYTVGEMLNTDPLVPQQVLMMGGPASIIAGQLQACAALPVTVIPNFQVANAIGAALARTTCEVSLYADTERGILVAPDEAYMEEISDRFTGQDAMRTAQRLLRTKAQRRGALAADPEMEILEAQEFNMVRGFSTSGKNIRLRLQVKPGLIADAHQSLLPQP
jgi:N-methylhydantoinase A/oxoprolinase/acetone carboxylase beta subunit